jgi:hypothetical protein
VISCLVALLPYVYLISVLPDFSSYVYGTWTAEYTFMLGKIANEKQIIQGLNYVGNLLLLHMHMLFSLSVCI